MMRKPWSMAAQLALLLLAGLLAAHLLAILALRINAEMLNPVARDRALERLVIARAVLRSADAAEVPELLDTLSSDSGRFWLEDTPPDWPQPRSAEERRVLASLQRHLPALAAEDVRVRLFAPQPGMLGTFDQRVGWSFMMMETAVRLPDGRWLHGQQRPLLGYQWWRLLRFSLPISTLPVLAIALLFLLRAVRPLKRLAGAAERMSRGERVEPLPVVGPREVREVSAAFNVMNERLLRFVDDRTRLLASLSHDLRTPITALRLRAELVEDEAQRNAIRKTLASMQVLVDQTLRFAQDATDEGTVELDLRTLLAELVAEQQSLGHDAVLEPGPPAPCRVRPVSLRRAAANLIDNAIRHGQRARVRIVPGTGGGLRVEIDDTGPGLDEGLFEQVFEPFFQLDPASRADAGGSIGLGLSIARSHARAHGGDVTLANRPDGGLRASLHLP